MFAYMVLGLQYSRACTLRSQPCIWVQLMWRPPQRIQFKPSPGRVPTRDEATRSRLFSSIKLGPLNFEQRTWSSGIGSLSATEDGFVTDDVIEWYRRFAKGCPGAIVVEATGIRDIPSGPLLRIGDDRFIPGLELLARTVREASAGRLLAKLIQLIDFLAIRRRPDPKKYFERYLTITDTHRAALGGSLTDQSQLKCSAVDAHAARGNSLRF